MKTVINRCFLCVVIMAWMFWEREASAVNTLHSFNESDGSTPAAALILSGNTLYGTTWSGGNSSGTIFAINTDGSGFTNLYGFTPTSGPFPHTNLDGATPNGLLLSGNTLYGAAKIGGTSGNGLIFQVNVDGTGFTNLHTFTATSLSSGFTNSDGANPTAGVILSGATLYGTAAGGGSWGSGTIFSMNIDGTGFITLYRFTATSNTPPNGNSDGAGPNGLILSGNTLYGTAQNGGTGGNGTVFAINTDGTGFKTIYNFSASSGVFPGPYTNVDGANPYASLLLLGNTLYGTAVNGGGAGNGTVFGVNTDGSGFSTLHSFSANPSSNSDGANPYGGLILVSNTLYGTAYAGGTSGYGTLFGVNTDGTGFSNVYDFTVPTGPYPPTNSDGAYPQAGLSMARTTLYGTASQGGASGVGTIFSFSFAKPPQLSIVRSEANVILMWPADGSVFNLQASTNSLSPGSWSSVISQPVVINGRNTVTEAISAGRKFYRLTP